MKPIKLSNVFVLTKNQMMPLTPRLKMAKGHKKVPNARPLPEKIQEINKES